MKCETGDLAVLRVEANFLADLYSAMAPVSAPAGPWKDTDASGSQEGQLDRSKEQIDSAHPSVSNGSQKLDETVDWENAGGG